MTPGERWRYARQRHHMAVAALFDAREELEEADREFHLARFLFVAASKECPTCGATPGAYCALFQAPDGTYTWDGRAGADFQTRLVALGLHPARTTTPEALEVAACP